MIQRIAIISTSISPVMLRAVFKDNELILEERKILPARRKNLLEALHALDVPKMVNAGFKVLVDEVSSGIAQELGATNICLRDKHTDGKPVLVAAFQRLAELKRQGSIILPQKGKSSFEISNSLVDVEFNPAGEPIYRIDWNSLKPEHVLILLAVYSTMFNNVMSTAYIKGMQSSSAANDRPHPLASFFNIIRSREEQVSEDTPKAKLTGTRIDDNTVIL